MHSPSLFFEANKMIKNISIALLLVSMILVASPLASAQAVTATTNKTNYVAGDRLSVAGVGPANDDVTVTLTNPNGALVGIAQGRVSSNNVYNVTVLTFPSGDQRFPFGAYSVRVTAAAAAASTTVTINFAATTGTVTPPPAVGGAGGLIVSVHAEGTYFSGDRVRIYAIITNNGALADPTAFSAAHVHRMDNTIDQLLGTQQRIHAGWYYFDYTVPANAAPGTYGVHVGVTLASAGSNGDAAFQVAPANRDTAALATQLTTINTAIQGVSTALNGLSQSFTAHDQRLTAIQTAVTTAQTAITGRINTLDTDITSRLNGVAGAVGTQIITAQNTIVQRVDGIPASVNTAVTTAVQNAQTAITTAVKNGFTELGGNVEEIEDSVRSAATGTAQSSTFVLVIAGLAALSVVLQIAILARKKSA